MSGSFTYETAGSAQTALATSFVPADTAAAKNRSEKLVSFFLSMLSRCRDDEAMYQRVLTKVNQCLTADQMAEICRRQMEHFDQCVMHMCVENLDATLWDVPGMEVEAETHLAAAAAAAAASSPSEYAQPIAPQMRSASDSALQQPARCIRCRGLPLKSALRTHTLLDGVAYSLCDGCDSNTRVALCSYQDQEEVVLLSKETGRVVGCVSGNRYVPPSTVFGRSYNRRNLVIRM